MRGADDMSRQVSMKRDVFSKNDGWSFGEGNHWESGGRKSTRRSRRGIAQGIPLAVRIADLDDVYRRKPSQLDKLS